MKEKQQQQQQRQSINMRREACCHPTIAAE